MILACFFLPLESGMGLVQNELNFKRFELSVMHPGAANELAIKATERIRNYCYDGHDRSGLTRTLFFFDDFSQSA